MKKAAWALRFMTMFLVLVVFLFSQTIHSAGKTNGTAKGRVSWSVKNGTLTFQGKGAIPSKIKVADKNKIKKIVVKKGITSVPPCSFREFKKVKEVVIAGSVRLIGEYAFPDSRELKKVTMPGSFRYAFDREEEGILADFGEESIAPSYKVHIDTISFNTKLSLETLSYVKSNHLNVQKGDPKYKSIKGVIYSKDGKSIVRVPAYRKSLKVEEGCEEFCTWAVEYGTSFGIFDLDWDDELVCKDLKKIELPASIQSINTKKYRADVSCDTKLKEIVINTDHIDSEVIYQIFEYFPRLDPKRFLKQFSDVLPQDGMYINRWDHSLILYTGKADKVTIPDHVNKIVGGAFEKSKIKHVVIPDSVTEIGAEAFYDCRHLQEVRLPQAVEKMGTSVFAGCSKLKSVQFPNGLSEVPDYTFSQCTSLEEVVLPDSIATIGTYAFSNTKVPPSILLQGNIKNIKSYAFSSINWEELVLPETVEKAGKCALKAKNRLRKVTISGSPDGIDPEVFDSFDDALKDLTLVYEKPANEWKTLLNAFQRKTCVSLQWFRIEGADGWHIQVSKDKSFQKKTKDYYVEKEKTKLLIKGRYWYVRIRPFQMEGENKLYGRWSMEKLK